MSEAPLFSIVVPVYNAEAYLDECLSSIKAQTFYDFELICVDDGSTDASPDILKTWEARIEKMRIVTQENKDVGAARNAGLDVAQGVYVTFVDADDTISEDFLAAAVSDIQSSAPDILVVSVASVPPGPWDAISRTKDHDASAPLMDVLFDHPGARPFPVAKFYRRDLLDDHGIRFDEELAVGEDHEFLFQVFPLAQSALFRDRIQYFYRQNDASKMHVVGADVMRKLRHQNTLANKVFDRMDSYGIFEDYRQRLGEWYCQLVAIDVLRLPNNQAKIAATEFLTIFDRRFPGVKLNDQWQKDVDAIRRISTDGRDPSVIVVASCPTSADACMSLYDGLRIQTLRNFLLVLVDSSPQETNMKCLRSIIDTDARVIHLTSEAHSIQEVLAGIAQVPTAEYVISIDSSDALHCDMLERMMLTANSVNADVCVCAIGGIDGQTGDFFPAPWTCDTTIAPQECVLDGHQHPDKALRFTTPAVSNKLFRRDLLSKTEAPIPLAKEHDAGVGAWEPMSITLMNAGTITTIQDSLLDRPMSHSKPEDAWGPILTPILSAAQKEAEAKSTSIQSQEKQEAKKPFLPFKIGRIPAAVLRRTKRGVEKIAHYLHRS